MSIPTHHQNKTLIEQDDQKATAVLKRMNLNTHRKLNQALTLQITQKTTSMKKKNWESRHMLNSKSIHTVQAMANNGKK